MSSTKVKGLLKGLKYISHVFEEKEDDEIRIGFPTDVKHVAHIGWDGPSTNAPSWMTEFKANSEISPEATKYSQKHGDNNEKITEVRKINDIPQARHNSIDGQPNSPTRKSSNEKKHTRRHRSSDTSSENSTRESFSDSRHSRRPRHSNHGGESQSQDGVAVPKQTRRRKKNVSVDGGSVRSNASSIADIGSMIEDRHGSKHSES